jgi:hypothetical protein
MIRNASTVRTSSVRNVSAISTASTRSVRNAGNVSAVRASSVGNVRTAQTNFSLTVITLTVYVINNAVFEYQNQVIFNMHVFGGGPSLSY